MPGDPRDDVEAFARVAVTLSAAREDRPEVLAALGLTEEDWEALEDAWEVRLEEAELAEGEDGMIPALVTAHAEAFAAAQAERARGADEAALPFDRFVGLTRAMRRGGRLDEVLAAERVSLEVYLRAHAHWTRAILADPSLRRAFDEGLR